ncbi:potassium channel subfamily K member 18-like [Ptychodera flava]|uniref:potassium channel subfamily K member 18-like n=1 Tax=Ptychodera flava TaxID=63121 RepID=UPI00396A5D1E
MGVETDHSHCDRCKHKSKHLNNLRTCTILTAMLALYLVIGTCTFRQIEGVNGKSNAVYNDIDTVIQNFTDWMNLLCEARDDNFTILSRRAFREFRSLILQEAIGPTGPDLWTWTSSCLFCVSVISTIGDGYLAPVTDVGRAVCMLYAVFGIPLTLVFLSHAGYALAMPLRILFVRFSKFASKKPMQDAASGRRCSFKNIKTSNELETNRNLDIGWNISESPNEGRSRDWLTDVAMNSEAEIVQITGSSVKYRNEAQAIDDEQLYDSEAELSDQYSFVSPKTQAKSTSNGKQNLTFLSDIEMAMGKDYEVANQEFCMRLSSPNPDVNNFTSTESVMKNDRHVIKDRVVRSNSHPMIANRCRKGLFNFVTEGGRISKVPHKLFPVNRDSVTKGVAIDTRNVGVQADLNPSGLTRHDHSGEQDKEVPLTIIVLIVMAYLCLGGLFVQLSTKLSFFDSFYFSLITMTTIGFGDLELKIDFSEPKEKLQMVGLMLYTIFGLVILSVCFSLSQKKILSGMKILHRWSDKCGYCRER